MRSVKAVFKKQAKDTIRDVSMLAQFLMFPAVPFAMMELVARGEMFAEFGWPRTMFITMMAATFVGIMLIPFVAGIIAEDWEKKILRFLLMTGVDPHGYLLGIGSRRGLQVMAFTDYNFSLNRQVFSTISQLGVVTHGFWTALGCVRLPAAMGGLPLDTLVPRPTWRR